MKVDISLTCRRHHILHVELGPCLERVNWVGYSMYVQVASQVVNQHPITCEPHVVWFSDRKGYPARLNVKLKAVNMPVDKGLDYNVIAYFKTDGAYKKKYTLKLGSKYTRNEVVEILQNVNKDWDECYVAYCFYEESKGTCELDKDTLYDVIKLQYSEKPEYSDCIAGRCELTIDLQNYCIAVDMTAVSAHRPPYNRGWGPLPPQKIPSPPDLHSPSSHRMARKPSTDSNDDSPKLSLHDVETGNYESQVIIKCSAVGLKFDLLYLYQLKPGKKHELLKIVQHLEEEKGEITLSLNKNLVYSDKESTLICTKENLDGPTSNVKGGTKKLRSGDYKYIREDHAENASVTVVPATHTAWFSRHKPLSLVCRGTTLLDTRSLTWYIRDEKTAEIELPEPSSQVYDRETNEQRLMLWLNDSHDSKTLFCAQDYHLEIEHANGRRSVKRYGVLAESKNITLRLQEETEDDAQTGVDSSGPNRGLVCGLVVGITMLLVLAAILVRRLCKRTMKEGEGHEENQYATAVELTYAVLDLPEPGAGAPVKGHDNTSPYAQIIGVYNPRKKA